MSEDTKHFIKTLTLMRGQTPVTSFLGAFGGALRETRITAMLGYLIAHDPDSWKDFFSLADQIASVEIEADHEKDRSDILIETPNERVIIEGGRIIDPELKITDQDIEQAKKLGARDYIVKSNFSLQKVVEKIMSIIEARAIKVTKLGRGLSTGTELEYVDKDTMVHALKRRS